jgi:hypothetical protein
MDAKTEVLDFVKAMASADRLRVIGVLVRGRATRAEIAEQLHLPVREVFQHLSFLEHVNVVHEEDGVYELDEEAIETLARSQFEGKRAVYESAEGTSEVVRKVLKAYLKSDGTLKQIPMDPRKLRVILAFIVDVFPFDTTFTEKEVNTILRRFHVDTPTLRRGLVDEGYMARESDGSKYWRVRKDALS